MTVINENHDHTITLNAEQESVLAKQLSSRYKRMDSERMSQLSDIKTLREAVYTDMTGAKDGWHATYKSTDMYEIAQTLKSHLTESLYSHPDAMFDVSGKTQEAQELANQQKSALVNAFEQMRIGDELEKVINSVVESGETTLFVGWKTQYKTVRRRKTEAEQALSVEGGQITLEQELVYDGADVKFVPSEDFVFDVKRKNNWDSCLKIYKTMLDEQEILAQKTNNLMTNEKIEQIKEITESKHQKNNDNKDSSQLEVLEVWGDIVLDNKTTLKNWLVTIVEREIIVRSEPNPYVINPFIYANIITDPQTQRGISPLRVALPVSSVSSTILNKQLDALALIINPPYLAPKGCFKGEQAVKPGKIIEYDSALMPNQPIPLKFESALVGWEFIKFFKSTMETSTGIFKNMTGDYQPQSRTATEVTYSQSSQAVRLNAIIESINRKLIIPMVEKTADIIAGFKFGDELVPVMQSGKTVFIEITDKVRQNKYLYRYGDRKASLERKYKFKELYEIISQLCKVPEIAGKIDWEECFTFALEQYGVENSSIFLKQDPSQSPPLS